MNELYVVSIRAARLWPVAESRHGILKVLAPDEDGASETGVVQARKEWPLEDDWKGHIAVAWGVDPRFFAAAPEGTFVFGASLHAWRLINKPEDKRIRHFGGACALLAEEEEIAVATVLEQAAPRWPPSKGWRVDALVSKIEFDDFFNEEDEALMVC